MEARERLEKYGAEGLSEADLLHIIVGRASGFTPLQQTRIKAAIELGIRKVLRDRPMGIKVSSPEDIAPILIPRLNGKEHEEFHVVLLNARNAIIDIMPVARGTVDACAVHPRDIFKVAIEKNATGIMIAHNHPSGNPRASEEDIALSMRVKEGAKTIGIRFLDSLIVAGNRLTSLRAMGVF